jgi:DNA-binding IclR family transcriptional regulator
MLVYGYTPKIQPVIVWSNKDGGYLRMATKEQGPESRNGVQSADIAMTILEAVAGAHRRVTLSEVARQLKFSPGKVHRYFVSFVRAGILVQQPDSGMYEFGPLALRIGLSAIGQIDAVRFASERMTWLCETTKQSLLLVVWGDMGPTVVRLEESYEALKTNVRVGSILPVLTTAIGHAFFAHLPSTYTSAFVRKEQKAQPGLKSLDLEKLAKAVRTARLAYIESPVLPDVSAIACPILDTRGYAVAVVAALGVTSSGSMAVAGVGARTIRQFCIDISKRLGDGAMS